jgi:L-ascorbate metabolism protein UlaG (beta-lactamase superfamily)
LNGDVIHRRLKTPAGAGMVVKLRYAKCWMLVAALLVPPVFPHLSFSQAEAGIPNTSGLEITYLGNEGVMISAGKQQVLIDAVHGPYSEYVSPPAHELRAMQEGKFPYNGPEVVLVTHVHGDHFSARALGLHLEHNKSAVLVSSQQVVNSMRRDFAGYDRIRSQIREVTPAWKQRQGLQVNGVGIDVLGLRHGGEEFHAVQNLGYVVRLGSWTLLHVGDADATEENLRSFNLQQEGIDVAFLPFWYLMTPEGQALVREHIRPKHIIAVHIPRASASELEKPSRDIRAAFPNSTIFSTLMQKKQF